MFTQFFQERRNAIAGIGIVVVIPAAIIVLFGLMNEAGFPAPNDWLDNLISTNATAKILFEVLLHPAVVLGGLALALCLNSIPLFYFKIQPEEASLVTVISLKNRLRNAAMVALSAFLLGSLTIYAFFENFQIVPR
ncbi:MAG: hypothetical protein AAB269_02745 [Bacteroidota bacterium]